jgi:hypothetical protein
MLRRLILDDIKAVMGGAAPRAFQTAQAGDGLIKIDSFTGIRRKESESLSQRRKGAK